MTERWFEDLPDHDPEDPEAVERALRRQERANRRRKSGDDPGPGRPEPETEESVATGSVDPERRRRRGPRGPGGVSARGRRGLFVLTGIVALVGLAVAVFLFALFQPFAGEGEGKPFNLTIPQGASVQEVGDLLAENDVVSNATLFRLRAKLSGKDSDIREGDHRFRRSMSYAAALDVLARSTVSKQLTVTVPEGLSRSETAELISGKGVPGNYLSASVKSNRLNPQNYGAQGRAENLEGFLFPATYELKKGSDAADLVRQQLDAFKDNIGSVNMKYARKKNLNTYDVLTIASMIEREVSVPAERRKVAAVIYNRLKQGEPLGIDATIRFAVDNWQDPLTESDLAVDSAYNTRTNAGLPPGPIGSPGLASIKAAANPARIDALFYVVKPGTCGEHNFSTTLEEFNRDAEAYRKAQEEAGGSPTDC